MEALLSVENPDDILFENTLLTVLEQSFGQRRLTVRHRAIRILIALVKSKAKDNNINLTSGQAFRVLCDQGIDFEALA